MLKDKTYLLDALIFAKKIIKFTEEINEETFIQDEKTQAAVLYEISVLGEALKRISPEFKEKYSEIPYRQIMGMRNKLVHDYDGININLVWQVIKINIPQLIETLEKIITNL